MKKFLFIVDPQNDFITGSLEVPGAVEAMDNLVEHLKNYGDMYSAVIVSRDCHPEDHCSFVRNGGMWADHCVYGTSGMQFYDKLNAVLLSDNINRLEVVNKGYSADKEEYSAVCDSTVRVLDNVLEYYNGEIVIAGLAGDYCVKATLLDLMKRYPSYQFTLLENCIASIDSSGKTEEFLQNVVKFHNYGQIISHFTDNDLYTFTCQYFALMNFPRAEIKYQFFDRDKTVYPAGFAEALREQMNYMKNVVITDEEIKFMQSKIDFLPVWYYTFLRGFRFNPDELTITQDYDGHLHVDVEGPWFSAIFWEMPILSCVSELMHYYRGEHENYNRDAEYNYAYDKAVVALNNGLYLADMGTRRRFSYLHHDLVVRAMKDAAVANADAPGKITGTSNVYFAMKYNMTPIGTMSHQTISFVEGTMSSPFEVNHTMMELWSKTFDGNCGIYLSDCFTSKTFFNSLSLRQAKLWDGTRVDSGDEFNETDMMIEKYKSLGINPLEKSIVFSNGLNIDKAIKIHEYCEDKIKDSYGIGTYLTCDLTTKIKPMNIVVKAVAGRITEKRVFVPLVKVSNDSGKAIGNVEKCNYLREIIEKY